MNTMNTIGTAMWFSAVPLIFYVLCFYFTLTFFQQLKARDIRLQKQAKFFAVLSLALALSIPFIIQIFIMNQMNNF